jgi:hypothetical protein
MRPMSPDASPTCLAGTRSGTYPWNGPWAKLELNWSIVTKAATAGSVLEVATPQRKTTSRAAPMKM